MARIVEVQAADVVDAEMAVQLTDELSPAGGAIEAVAGGESVTGVDAEADTVAVIAEPADLGELLETEAEHGSLAGGVLEQQARGAAAARAEHPGQRCRHRLDPRLDAAAQVGAGMDDQLSYAEGLALAQLDRQGRAGTLQGLGIGRRQVDEVGAVGHRAP